ncbi:MAG TPA: DUF6220 domain-containing protein [Gaiellaceae bacterium]
MNALRTIYRWWAMILLVAIVVQIGFAGIGAFDALDKATAGSVDEDGFLDSFDLHAILGTLLVLGTLLLFLLALAARVGKQGVLYSLGIFVLVVVQMILGWTGSELPEILGFLHPINALIILGAIASLAMREWRGDRMMGRPGEPTAPPAAA